MRPHGVDGRTNGYNSTAFSKRTTKRRNANKAAKAARRKNR